MSGQWKNVVQVRFTGGRYEEKALDQKALGEILQLQKVLTETAKALWRQEHPGRERLPKRFEERVNFCVRKVRAGSTCVDLDVYVGKPTKAEAAEQGEFDFMDPEPTEARQAVALAREVFEAAERDVMLPERLPKALVGDYAEIGAGLSNSEGLEFVVSKRKRARVTAQSRERLRAYVEPSYEDQVEVKGKVLEADVKQRRFQLWKDESTKIAIAFTDVQEAQVLSALAEHASVELRVRGRGILSPQGKLESIREVTEMRLFQAGEEEFDPNARPIEDILMELAAEVPKEEWDKLPKDLSENLGHYLYGFPKK